MIYFRENELKKLETFFKSNKKAMAIYGRRRTGKTELVLEYIRSHKNIIYFQCTGYDYNVCLRDFKETVKSAVAKKSEIPVDTVISSLSSFREVISVAVSLDKNICGIIIDEFPFLAKKNENVTAEFQWIIDHGLNGKKLVLLGSNRSFMKHQIENNESPLYGRFDEIIQVNPFTFSEVNSLFPSFEDAVDVYAKTGGVAQYVMFFKNYDSVEAATEDLFFNKDGRLFLEANNMLMQEYRDVTTYINILRSFGGGEKDSGQIASKTNMDHRAVFTYLAKLVEQNIIETVENPLSQKKKEKRYRICDNIFRFNYTFIEPNVSMITAIGPESMKYILTDRYSEYLGFVYEDIIRKNCYGYAAAGKIPFMPGIVGKWWGNIQENGIWHESEVDLAAYDNDNIIIGECKYKNKACGISELELLQLKANFIPKKDRKVYYLIASKSGFTSELKEKSLRDNIILIDQV